MIIIFGVTGFALMIYCTVKSYLRIKNLFNQRKIKNEIEKMRQKRLEKKLSETQPLETSDSTVSNFNCVICLSKPRELILFDCGHVCLCMDCLEKLSSPICPVCRQSYRDFAPCYLP